MKSIIYNIALLGSVLTTSLTNAQVVLGALDGGGNLPKVELWDRTHYIASFNHNGANIDGTLANSGTDLLALKIPYNQASVNGAYDEINVVRTVQDRNGANKTLTLHIPAGRFITAKGFLNATIKIGNGTTDTYKVKQLLANTEEEITNFTFSMDGRTSTVKLIATGGLLDKNWDVQTDGAYKHKFVYVPISVPANEKFIPDTGKPYEHTWLNNNLGAEYANANNPRGNFNPTKQATAHNDHLAYGSLYQWQRPSDGHELVTWTSATAGTLTPTTTTLSNNANWTAGHSNFILDIGRVSWVTDEINNNTSKHDLWYANGANNPCPVGYHVPTRVEWYSLESALGRQYWDDIEKHWIKSLGLPETGVRGGEWGELHPFWSIPAYWMSEMHNVDRRQAGAFFPFFDGDIALYYSYKTGYGLPVRCLKDS